MNLRGLAALVAATSLAAVASETAEGARLISTDGSHGRAYLTEPGAQCYFPFGLNGQYRYLLTRPPLVYALDTTGSKDWNWIRFRTNVVNYWTGARIHTTPWSEWRVAYDDAPAPFTGTQQVALTSTSGSLDLAQWPGTARSQVEIEWWTQTNRIGGGTLEVSYYELLGLPTTNSEETVRYGIAMAC
jgi:hypothetical protein